MNNTLSKVLIFAAGAAVGTVVTWKVLEKKYTAEIESVKEVYRKKNERSCEDITDKPTFDYDEEEVGVVELNKTIDAQKYRTYSDVTPEQSEQLVANVVEEEDVERPYVIPPEEYGELHGYDMIDLTFYSDGTLADDMDNPVNIEDTVGQAALGCFGEYEDDAVHVRNDKRKADYEVLLDVRKYSDVVNNGPRNVED